MEVLVYGNINEWTARDFFTSINDGGGNSLTVRINTDGGSPEYGWGMIAKQIEFEGDKTVKVDGKAYSMGAFMCLYADDVEALDVSEFMVHRAAYPSWMEEFYFNPESEYYDEGLKSNLVSINKSLEKAFNAKIDIDKFEEITGVTSKQLFAMDWNKETKSFTRVDVFLDAKQAKQIGLISKINKITPERSKSIKGAMLKIAAQYVGKPIETPTKKDNNTDSDKNASNSTIITKTNKMTKEEFKSKFPEAYNALVKEVEEAAISAERERVDAWMTFHDVDAEAVKIGISEGKDLGMKVTAEFTKKMAMKGIVEKAGEASPEPTPEASKTEAEEKAAKSTNEDEPKMSEFEKQINAELGIEEKV